MGGVGVRTGGGGGGGEVAGVGGGVGREGGVEGDEDGELGVSKQTSRKTSPFFSAHLLAPNVSLYSAWRAAV